MVLLEIPVRQIRRELKTLARLPSSHTHALSKNAQLVHSHSSSQFQLTPAELVLTSHHPAARTWLSCLPMAPMMPSKLGVSFLLFLCR